MKVRLLFLATLVSSNQDDLDENELEKAKKKDEAEDFDQTAVVAQALENVRKIFKDINTENGRENAIKDLEKLLGEADQFVDTMDFGLNREDIEEVVNDLASGGYSDEEFQEDLKIAAGAASKLYENIATTGELPSMQETTEMMKELIVEESSKSERVVKMADFENLEKQSPVEKKIESKPIIHPTFSSIEHLDPVMQDEELKCLDSWYLNGNKVNGCSQSLRKDERPWCSTDEIFVGNFIFCPESEEELSHRLSRVKGKQLFTEAMAVLNANSRPEKYIVGLELLENSVDLGCEEAIIQTALFQVFGLHYEQDIAAGIETIEKYAAEGYSMAQSALGNFHASGFHVPVSQSKALLYWQFAALDGNREANLALGYRYYNGIGLKKNCKKASEHYSRVAADVATDTQRLSHAPFIHQVRIVEEDRASEDSSEVLLDEELLQYYAYLAEKGDLTSQVNLAQLLLQRGFDDDVNKAAKLFQLAAEEDHALGSAFLGRMYLEGVGVKPDNYTALKLFRKAADKGNAIGQAGLGLMYLEGRATEVNQKTAVKYFKQSADQGWNEGQMRLGLAYLKGTGVQKDPKEAYKYLQLASREQQAGFGNLLAFWYMAEIHSRGIGVLPNCDRAVAYYKYVAEHGIWNRLFLHSWSLWKNKNVDSAYALYSYLAELGYEKAQSNVAAILDGHELDVNYYNDIRYSKALNAWKRAAGQNFAAARLKVGDYYWYGKGVDVDYIEAAEHYRRAADETDSRASAQAYFNLGWMHHTGQGLPKDFHLSKRFYDMAAERSPEANLPSTIALVGLYFGFVSDSVKSVSSLVLSPSIPVGESWDLWLMSVLALLLSFVYAYRRN